MQFMQQVLDLSPGTIATISVICGIGVHVTVGRLASPVAGFLIYPVAVVASLGAMHVAHMLHLIPSRALDVWLLATVLSSAAGMAFGLIVVAIFVQLLGLVAARRHRNLTPAAAVRRVRFGHHVDGRG